MIRGDYWLVPAGWAVALELWTHGHNVRRLARALVRGLYFFALGLLIRARVIR